VDDPGRLMQAAAEVARVAGAVALGYYRRAPEVETKADGSPVTIADRNAEEAARRWLEARFPGDGVHGEEFGVTRPDAVRRWLLDPIDGTRTFVRGVPLWGTLVAVAEGATVLAGAAWFPALDEMLAAGIGCGAWHNDSRCRVSSVAELDQAAVLVTDDRFPDSPSRRDGWRALAHRAGMARTWGDCYGYLLVATGRAEVMIDDRVGPWDTAALYPAIVEAGGVFTDWEGQATPFGSGAIASNAALARPARALLMGDSSPAVAPRG
jgi:histidinol-phosphatase